MELINPSVQIETLIDQDRIMMNLERYGRTAYKSEDKITPGSAEKFVRKIIESGHESVIEHESLTVRFICDRGVTHELVRHRLASYTQESTRYCNYAGKVRYIVPDFALTDDDIIILQLLEEHYTKRLSQGLKPQQARYFLPNGLKTEIVATMNLRQWRHVLRQRTSPFAHPQMRQLMNLLRDSLKEKLPVIFGDL